MSIEIEAKIKCDKSILTMAEKISKAIEPVYPFKDDPTIATTKDWYLYPPDDSPAARFREEYVSQIKSNKQEMKTFFTTKRKAIVNGIEQNLEDEIEIQDKAAEMAKYTAQGYTDIGYVKVKSGLAFKFLNGMSIRVEAVLAQRASDNVLLGNYYEIEQVLSTEASQEDVLEARKLIENVIALLGYTLKDTEPRSWKELCAQALENHKREI